MIRTSLTRLDECDTETVGVASLCPRLNSIVAPRRRGRLKPRLKTSFKSQISKSQIPNPKCKIQNVYPTALILRSPYEIRFCSSRCSAFNVSRNPGAGSYEGGTRLLQAAV